ncbi:helix-turn-helix domain-containing protein [Streptomyces lasalocidi]|uniref:Helix-turn-helix domain-containing protein n=1 Tax=Streptomyces lasalocidi TaxID=324833 RepID=A0A4U5W675_STRLS|nr:helix-turn-helix domain-containing protein [Streptomyces lasalocidi]
MRLPGQPSGPVAIGAVSFKPSPVVPPLTRPQLAEARRVRAAELFGQRRSGVEITRMLGVSEESVRRWRRVWEEGGADGCVGVQPVVVRPSWMMPRSSGCGPRWSRAPRPMVSRLICGRWSGSVWSSSR